VRGTQGHGVAVGDSFGSRGKVLIILTAQLTNGGQRFSRYNPLLVGITVQTKTAICCKMYSMAC